VDSNQKDQMDAHFRYFGAERESLPVLVRVGRVHVSRPKLHNIIQRIYAGHRVVAEAPPDGVREHECALTKSVLDETHPFSLLHVYYVDHPLWLMVSKSVADLLHRLSMVVHFEDMLLKVVSEDDKPKYAHEMANLYSITMHWLRRYLAHSESKA